MDKTRTISGRIDNAFGPLLMARDILDDLMPESMDEQARALAAQFVAKLIKAAVDELTPGPIDALNTVFET